MDEWYYPPGRPMMFEHGASCCRVRSQESSLIAYFSRCNVYVSEIGAFQCKRGDSACV